MRKFLSLLLCAGALHGMEELDSLPAVRELEPLDHGYDRPVLKLAAKVMAMRNQQPIGPSTPPIDSVIKKYQEDAHIVLTALEDVLGREFNDEETINDLAYYQKKYFVSYQSFINKIKRLQNQPKSEQKTLQMYQLAFDFTLIAREAHNDNSDFHQSTATALTQQQIALQDAHQEQITKTKYANWRAYGAAAAGFVLTLTTGLITYFEHPANGSTSTATTSPANFSMI